MTPRVAIVCSGLGYIARGNEVWAATVAEGLHKSGGNVILFGSGTLPGSRSPYVRLRALRRDSWWRRFFSWDKAYLYEQVSFARSLRSHLRRDRFDIVHTSDPNVAEQLIKHCARQNIALIYKDGLFIGPKWCGKFKHVQGLAPFYTEMARCENVDTSGWRIVPHGVNTRIFAPPVDKTIVRQKLFQGSLKSETPVILAVGDFSKEANKRLDWIINETARAQSAAHLILIGNASEADRAALEVRANEKLPGRARVLCGLSHAEMPAYFQCADLFVHAAEREPFGLVLIEAMACGVPTVAHHFEVSKWIIGNGGLTIDMTKPGELAQAIDRLITNRSECDQLTRNGIARVRSVFDKDVILPLYHQWYGELAQRQNRT